MAASRVAVLGSGVLVAWAVVQGLIACRGGGGLLASDDAGAGPDAASMRADEQPAPSRSRSEGGSSCGAPELPPCNGQPIGSTPVANPTACGPDGGLVTCLWTAGTGPLGAVGVSCRDEPGCPGESFACGSSAACPDGQRCCADFAGGKVHATCKDSCAASDEVQLCAGDAECNASERCAAYSCPQTVVRNVQSCTKPPPCSPR